MSPRLDIFVDGACRGNPGPAAIACVILDGEKTVKEFAKTIGSATNNIAEYTALIYALQEALILKGQVVRVHSDSELLIRQLKGDYKVKHPSLKFLYDLIQHLSGGFKKIELCQIPREENSRADELASRILKNEQAKVVAPVFDFGEESPSSGG